jgi:AcrR family transcriptional regulator
VEAALALFGDRGFDATTIRQIAELAGVSQRTIFHYFPTKDDILFNVPPAEIRELQRFIGAQPRGMSDLEIIETAMVAWLQRAGRQDETARALTQLLVRAAAISPTLRGRQAEFSDRLAAAAAATIAARRGEPSPSRATLRLCQLAFWAMHAIVEEWVDTPGAFLGDIMAARFAELKTVFADPTRV